MAHVTSQLGTRSSGRTAALVTAILVLAMAGAPTQATSTSSQRHVGWSNQEAETLRRVASILVTRVVLDLRDGRWERHACSETRLGVPEIGTTLESDHGRYVPPDDLVRPLPLRETLLNLPPPSPSLG